MPEEDNEPFESVFAKRAKLVPKNSIEELKAAEDLVTKLEEESEAEKAAAVSKKGKKSGKKSGNKKKSASGTAEDIDYMTVDVDSVSLSAAAKRRLKKLEDQAKRELEIMEAENAKILSANTSELPNFEEEPEVPEKNKTIYLTVNYFNKYKRFNYHEDEKFLKVFQDVAEFFELNPAEILLCLKDRNITISDTPKTLGLTESDILECLPYKIDETSVSTLNDNFVKITFQSNDTKAKLDMNVNKMEKMSCIMERYSKKRNLPLNELTFEFDGEKLLGTETPGELDMESGSCIDVRVFVPVAQCSYVNDAEPRAHCSYMTDAEDSMDRYLVLDNDSNDSDIVVLN